MVEITSLLSLSVSMTLAGVGLCSYAIMSRHDRLWAAYPILDSWLMAQHYRAEKVRQRALLTGITLVFVGLAGTLFRY